MKHTPPDPPKFSHKTTSERLRELREQHTEALREKQERQATAEQKTKKKR